MGRGGSGAETSRRGEEDRRGASPSLTLTLPLPLTLTLSRSRPPRHPAVSSPSVPPQAYLENKDQLLQRRLTKRWKRAYLRDKEEKAKEARHQERRDAGLDSETEEEEPEEEEEAEEVEKVWTAEGCAEDLCKLSPEDRLVPLMELELSIRAQTVAAMPLHERGATFFELSIPDRASLLSMMELEVRCTFPPPSPFTHHTSLQARVPTWLTIDEFGERLEVLKELPVLHRGATLAEVPLEDRLETCREVEAEDRLWLLCEMPVYQRAETMAAMEPKERGDEFKEMDPDIKAETLIEIKAQEKLGTPEEELEKLEYKTSFEAWPQSLHLTPPCGLTLTLTLTQPQPCVGAEPSVCR